jgi:D-alanyl-D-alanine dipeptidase
MVQRQIHEATEREYREQHPEWPAAVLRRTGNRFSAPPRRPRAPTHCTGGAIDLDLTTEDGERLDLTAPYALPDRRSAAMEAPGLSPTARKNRERTSTRRWNGKGRHLGSVVYCD